MKPPVIETWNAVYRRESATSNVVHLIALLKPDEDEFIEFDPATYFKASRRIKLSPAPLEVLPAVPVNDAHAAILLLDAIVNGPDESLPIDEAKKFLERFRKNKTGTIVPI